jgi:hypothetical protein
MLHEAVHALAQVRGVKDTSRGRQVPQQARVRRPRRRARPGPKASGRMRSSASPRSPSPSRPWPTPTPWRTWVRRSGCTATPSAAWACSAAKAKAKGRTATGSSRPGRPASGSRSPVAASRHGRSGSAPSSTPGTDHLRGLRPGLPTPGRRQQQGRQPCWKAHALSGCVVLQALRVRWQRGSGSAPGRPERRPAQGPAPPGGREACLAGAGTPPPAPRS